MTDKPNLADARRVAEAAIEGPWTAEDGPDGFNPIVTSGGGLAVAYTFDKPHLSDATFIAASRQLVPAMEQALRAVLALHSPIAIAGGSPLCGHCADTGDPFCTPDGADEYPCKTVRAITQYIDIETGDARRARAAIKDLTNGEVR